MTKLQLRVTSRKEKDEQLKDVADLAVQFIKGDKGEKGDIGEKGKDGEKGDVGLQGKQGDTGKQGERGEQGEKGERGDNGKDGKQGPKGEQGPAGKDGISPEIGEIVIDYKQITNTPQIQEIVWKATQSSKTTSLSELDDVDLSGLTKTDGKYVLTPGGSSAETFESVSSNLKSYDYVINYDVSGNVSTIVYSNGVTKTLNYTSGDVSSIVLSGSTPSGISLTKTLTYSLGDVVGITYS